MKIAILGATSQIARDMIVSFSSMGISVPLNTRALVSNEVVAERINRS